MWWNNIAQIRTRLLKLDTSLLSAATPRISRAVFLSMTSIKRPITRSTNRRHKRGLRFRLERIELTYASKEINTPTFSGHGRV